MKVEQKRFAQIVWKIFKKLSKQVVLRIIGLIKADCNDSSVFITPTEKEGELLYEEGIDIIATDATNRVRPGGKTLEEFFIRIRKKYPNQLFMADCASFEEAEEAEKLGYKKLVDRKSTRLNSSHVAISYAVFCLKKKK